MDLGFLALAALALYGVAAALLARRGLRQVSSLEGFFVGNRDLHPGLIGLSLAGQLTAVGTFVVHPGLVYAHGLAGLLGVGLSAVLGSSAGVLLLSRGFRRLAEELGALTLPGWLGRRYGSRRLQVGFALLALALVSLLALVLTGFAPLAAQLLGLPRWSATLLLGCLVLVGHFPAGASGSVRLSALHATIMAIAAAALAAGVVPRLLAGDLLAELRDRAPALATLPPGLARTIFEVFAANFLVGMALVCQPQVAARLLHLKTAGDGRFLFTTLAIGWVIALVLLCGLQARVALGPGLPPEQVLVSYVQQLSGSTALVGAVGVLCAGLITLDGLLLALSGILALDLLEPLRRSREQATRTLLPGSPQQARLAVLAISLAVLVLTLLHEALGHGGLRLIAVHALHLFMAAAFVPIALGLFIRRELPSWLAVIAALVATSSYLGLLGGGAGLLRNPVVLAALGIVASGIVTAGSLFVDHAWRRRVLTAVESMCHPGPSRS